MKNELGKKWEKLDERAKDTIKLIAALIGFSGLLGVSAQMQHQEDVRLDALCGQDRSACVHIVDQMTCDSVACGREEKWIPKEPVRK